MMLQPREYMLELEPYALPDVAADGEDSILQLAQNESAMGASPRAVAAARSACATSALYPDPDATALRGALAELHGIRAAQIVCARGSMELISLLATGYLWPGCSAVTSQYGYLYFRTATRIAGAQIVTAEEPQLVVDVDALCAAVRDDTRIVWVANPGNPTGSYLPRDELWRLRSTLPEGVLLVIDEAYAEYLGEDRYPGTFDFAEQTATVVLRTFSKIYGLAGLRTGWGYFPPEVTRVIRALLQPNAVTGPAQAAAIAALRDTEHRCGVRDRTAAIAADFASRMRACDLTPLPAHGNFVLVRFASVSDAQAAEAHLRGESIVVRPMGGYGLADCLRVTVGTSEQMSRVAAAIEAWCNEA